MRKKREKCVKMHIEGISSQFRLVTLIVTLFRQYFIDSFFFLINDTLLFTFPPSF